MSVDTIDRRMLLELQRDARISNARLAERVHLSPTPCLRRLRKLERTGVIRGYTVLLDERALGYSVSALAFVRLVRHTAANAQAFETAVHRFAEVMECNVVTGSHDYVLRILAADLAAYDAFVKTRLAAIEQVANIETMIILDRPLVRHALAL